MFVDPYSIILFKGSGSVSVAPAGCFICFVVLLCVVVLGILSSLAFILQRRFT